MVDDENFVDETENDKTRINSSFINEKLNEKISYEIITPEKMIEEAHKKRRFINEDFERSVIEIEKKKGSTISEVEFDNLCKEYATIYCKRENDLNGLDDRNAIDKDLWNSYYNSFKSNKRIVSKTRAKWEKVENPMVDELKKLYEEALESDAKGINEVKIKKDGRLNVRYKGKALIVEDDNGKTIRIDNKADVSLLHMKYRQEVIERQNPGLREMIQNDGEKRYNRPSEDDFE